MGAIQCKLRLPEAIQKWYFECMPFKNCWTDLLEFFTESVKVYTHCVCEVSQRSELNCVFDNQEIEITYKHYSTLNTWATPMKQKLNYSQYVEQEQDIFRYVKNSELTREIRCHSDRIFPNPHQCYQWYSAPPPTHTHTHTHTSNYVLFLAILPVFESFPRCCC